MRLTFLGFAASLCVLGFLSGLLANSGREPRAVIALTFDTYPSTYYVAFPIMQKAGLTGTFFVDALLVDEPGQVTAKQLHEMADAGWEIGVYSGRPLPDYAAQSSEAHVRDWLRVRKERLAQFGFDAKSLAAGGRQWDKITRSAAEGLFEQVRVASQPGFQKIPPPDPLSIQDGFYESLDHHHTAAELLDNLDQLERLGGLWPVVVHKVGSDVDLSVSTSVFQAFIDGIAEAKAVDKVEVLTFAAAVAFP